jgi:hypothetical protein
MEAQAVLRRLTHCWPDLELASGLPVWNGNAVYRGLSRMLVCTGRGGVLRAGAA